MKLRDFFVILAVILVPQLLLARTNQSLQFPEYNNWPIVSSVNKSAEFKGKTVDLKVDYYQYADYRLLKRTSLGVIHNENGDPWFSIVQYEVGKRLPDGKINTEEVRYYLFENTARGWQQIKEFDVVSTLNADINQFIKIHFSLNFK
jgi:hypothetical protein